MLLQHSISQNNCQNIKYRWKLEIKLVGTDNLEFDGIIIVNDK